jgi:hypothetical protein
MKQKVNILLLFRVKRPFLDFCGAMRKVNDLFELNREVGWEFSGFAVVSYVLVFFRSFQMTFKTVS